MKVKGIYFSPTHQTEKVVKHMVTHLNDLAIDQGENKGPQDVCFYNFTPKDQRNRVVAFEKGDIVVIGFPVYAGRLPNVLKKDLQNIVGNGAQAILIVTFGNRSPGHALLELYDVMTQNDFNVIAAGAFVAEHPFSNHLAPGRPNDKDFLEISTFVDRVFEKMKRQGSEPLTLDRSDIGLGPVGPYYIPKGLNGNPVSLLKVTPSFDGDKCSLCGACLSKCPMESLSLDLGGPEPMVRVTGPCIKCFACVIECPENAIAFTALEFIDHKRDLENRHCSPKISHTYV